MDEDDIHESNEARTNAMTVMLHDKDTLLQLRQHPGIMDLMLNLSPSQRRNLSQFVSMDHDIFVKLSEYPNALSFLSKLTDTQVNDVPGLLTWDHETIRFLKEDPEHITSLYRIWDAVGDKSLLIDSYKAAVATNAFDKADMLDAFSYGQIRSKAWLAEISEELGLSFKRTWILCGWIGVLAYMLLERQSQLGITRIRNFDIDPRCAPVADRLNKRHVQDSWKFKASTVDVNHMTYDGFQYTTMKGDGSIKSLIDTADTVINTSTDHLVDNKWFECIPDKTLVIIQNNNFRSVSEHINIVENEFELVARYPLTEVLYLGRLDCHSYNRFMLIGYK